MKRLFLAIPVPENVAEDIFILQKELKSTDIKLVEKENFHYNLRFFGNVQDERISSISLAVKRAIDTFSPFELEIKGVGFFPTEEHPRVVWLGVGDGKEILISLFEQIEESLSEVGFSKEARGFVPHLTIGRLRSTRNKNTLKKFYEKYADKSLAKFFVKEIVLFESKLSPKGPKYFKLVSYPLK